MIGVTKENVQAKEMDKLRGVNQKQEIWFSNLFNLSFSSRKLHKNDQMSV